MPRFVGLLASVLLVPSAPPLAARPPGPPEPVEVVAVNAKDPDRYTATLRYKDGYSEGFVFNRTDRPVEIDGRRRPPFALGKGMRGVLVTDPAPGVRYVLRIDTALTAVAGPADLGRPGNVLIITPTGTYHGFLPHGGADYPTTPPGSRYTYAWGPLNYSHRVPLGYNPIPTWSGPFIANPVATKVALQLLGAAAVEFLAQEVEEDPTVLRRGVAHALREVRDELIFDAAGSVWDAVNRR